MRRLAARGLAARSSPPTSTRPESAGRKPVTIFIVVDFPAPFGPRNPSTSPRRTEKLIPATASIGPKCLTRFSIRTSSLISRSRFASAFHHEEASPAAGAAATRGRPRPTRPAAERAADRPK